MTWDYFIFLDQERQKRQSAKGDQDCQINHLPAEERVDMASLCYFTNSDSESRSKARKKYMNAIRSNREVTVHSLVEYTKPDFTRLLSDHWIGLQVCFELLTSWYSKDDRVFHVMDNSLRKDRVFHVPFIAASSWKGMLRWACRMQAGLRDHLEKHNSELDDWQDPEWILHLFGNEKEPKTGFHQGALAFYPTWFNKIDFEVINPHSRANRAGSHPIYYEVVPGRRPKQNNSNEYEDGGKGTLSLLYAPWPGMNPPIRVAEMLKELLQSVETLLTTYGISAKRTVGWGTASILKWQAYHKIHGCAEQCERDSLWQEIQNWFPTKGDAS